MPAVNHERLRRRRDELDLSNSDLATRMDSALSYVQNIVSGADNPGWRLIYKLSRALDLPVEDIVVETKRRPRKKRTRGETQKASAA